MELPTFERVRKQFLQRVGKQTRQPAQVSSTFEEESGLSTGSPVFFQVLKRFGISTDSAVRELNRLFEDVGEIDFGGFLETIAMLKYIFKLEKTDCDSSEFFQPEDAPPFVWPEKDMINFKYSKDGEPVDTGKVVVACGLPQLRFKEEIAALKDFILSYIFHRSGIVPVRLHIPRDSAGITKGNLLVEFQKSHEAELANDFLNGMLFPKTGSLGRLLNPTSLKSECTFYCCRSRLFRHYSRSSSVEDLQSPSSLGAGERKRERKKVTSISSPANEFSHRSQSVVVKLHCLQQRLHEELALSVPDWPECCFSKWNNLEDSLVSALCITDNSYVLTEILKAETQISEVVIQSISKIQPKDETINQDHSKMLDSLYSLLSMATDDAKQNSSRTMAFRLHTLFTLTRTLALLERLSHFSSLIAELSNKLAVSRNRASAYLDELSQVEEKNSLLQQQLVALLGTQERINTLERQLAYAEKAAALAAAASDAVREGRCDKLTKSASFLSQQSINDWITLSDGQLLGVQADLEVALSKIKTARQEINRESRDSLCCICRDRPKSILLLPCRHLCLCGECAELKPLTHCPVCRTLNTEKLRVFG